MKRIFIARELAPFAGTIVSFKAADWFYTKDHCFALDDKMFAYIGLEIIKFKGGEKGHNISVLHNVGDNRMHEWELVNSTLNNMQLFLRLAEADEIRKINNSISGGDVGFGHSDPYLNKILKDYSDNRIGL